MKIACLMPTFNRASTDDGQRLLANAVASFEQQTHPDKLLIIGNDTPGQELRCDVPGVEILNWRSRWDCLGAKLQAMINVATARSGLNCDALCRWDDDDYSLPWRLSMSVDQLGDALEWRPSNYWFYQAGSPHLVTEAEHAGNTHIMSLWRPEVLQRIGGIYPQRTGDEDQAFNQALDRAGISPLHNKRLVDESIFYVYRWGVSDRHLSGRGGSPEQLQDHWDAIGERPIRVGAFLISPSQWTIDGLNRVKLAPS